MHLNPRMNMEQWAMSDDKIIIKLKERKRIGLHGKKAIKMQHWQSPNRDISGEVKKEMYRVTNSTMTRKTRMFYRKTSLEGEKQVKTIHHQKSKSPKALRISSK